MLTLVFTGRDYLECSGMSIRERQVLQSIPRWQTMSLQLTKRTLEGPIHAYLHVMS